MQTNQLNKRGEWTLPARSPHGLAAGSWVLACEANRSEEAVALCQPPEAWGCDPPVQGQGWGASRPREVPLEGGSPHSPGGEPMGHRNVPSTPSKKAGEAPS